MNGLGAREYISDRAVRGCLSLIPYVESLTHLGWIQQVIGRSRSLESWLINLISKNENKKAFDWGKST